MSSSNIYQTLSNESLCELINYHFHTASFEASQLKGGMFNTTYLIQGLPNNQKVVLRLGPVNQQLLLPFEENLMNGESYFYQLCRGSNIPVSHVLVCDTSRTLIDRDYMIVSYIESFPLSANSLDPAIKQKLYTQTGQFACEMHKIIGPQFGRLSSIQSGKGHTSWYKFLECEFTQWAEKIAPYSLFTPEEISSVLNCLRKNADLFLDIKVPHLVHADLWEGNILIASDGNQYNVCAIIDGDRAVFGDIDFEFASGWMINAAFLTGYQTPLPMDNASVKRRTIYQILYHLLDAYICPIEYNKPEEGMHHKLKALELLSAS